MVKDEIKKQSEAEKQKIIEEIYAESENNFEALCEVYNNNYKKCLPFLGAGISSPTGISNWDNLLLNLANCKEEKYTLTSIKELIAEHDYPKTASILKNKINDDITYKKFLSEQFNPTNTLTTSTIIKIVYKFHSIITTNFDTTVEEAIKTIDFIKNEVNKSGKQYLPFFDSTSLQDLKQIVYLHGHKDTDTFLLTEEEYKKFYPSNYDEKNNDSLEDLEDFLKNIITSMNLVFMGFSFEDENFSNFFKKRVEQFNQNYERKKEQGFTSNNVELNHFAFIKSTESSMIGKCKQLKKMGIKPIFFKGNYSDLEFYIEKLKVEKMTIKKEKEYPSE